MRFIIRWTFRLLFIAALAMAAAAILNLKREWELLTEAEIRERLQTKLDGRVSPDQMEVIQDKVVTYLKGVPTYIPEPEEAATEIEAEIEEEQAAAE